jgi:hypothetical protein
MCLAYWYEYNNNTYVIKFLEAKVKRNESHEIDVVNEFKPVLLAAYQNVTSPTASTLAAKCRCPVQIL